MTPGLNSTQQGVMDQGNGGVTSKNLRQCAISTHAGNSKYIYGLLWENHKILHHTQIFSFFFFFNGYLHDPGLLQDCFMMFTAHGTISHGN